MYLDDLFPGPGNPGLLTAQVQMTFAVFFLDHENLHDIALLEVGHVTEFIERNQNIALETYVQNDICFRKSDNHTFNHFTIGDCLESAFVNGVVLFFFFDGVDSDISFVDTPIEIIVR